MSSGQGVRGRQQAGQRGPRVENQLRGVSSAEHGGPWSRRDSKKSPRVATAARCVHRKEDPLDQLENAGRNPLLLTRR